LELGGGPASFFDDVDRSYVVGQLEGRMDAPVELTVVARRSSPLLRAPAEGAGDVPVLTVASRASAGTVRFLGVPRVNLFRALLEAVRRASTGDHGLAGGWAEALAALPRPVSARVFATPT
jgi:hypothetical protein